MVILKIDGEIYFSNVFHSSEFADMARIGRIGGHDYDEALLQFVFHMESCDEAIHSFDGFAVCPICGAQVVDGHMVHKDPEDLIQ